MYLQLTKEDPLNGFLWVRLGHCYQKIISEAPAATVKHKTNKNSKRFFMVSLAKILSAPKMARFSLFHGEESELDQDLLLGPPKVLLGANVRAHGACIYKDGER